MHTLLNIFLTCFFTRAFSASSIGAAIAVTTRKSQHPDEKSLECTPWDDPGNKSCDFFVGACEGKPENDVCVSGVFVV